MSAANVSIVESTEDVLNAELEKQRKHMVAKDSEINRLIRDNTRQKTIIANTVAEKVKIETEIENLQKEIKAYQEMLKDAEKTSGNVVVIKQKLMKEAKSHEDTKAQLLQLQSKLTTAVNLSTQHETTIIEKDRLILQLQNDKVTLVKDFGAKESDLKYECTLVKQKARTTEEEVKRKAKLGEEELKKKARIEEEKLQLELKEKDAKIKQMKDEMETVIRERDTLRQAADIFCRSVQSGVNVGRTTEGLTLDEVQGRKNKEESNPANDEGGEHCEEQLEDEEDLSEYEDDENNDPLDWPPLSTNNMLQPEGYQPNEQPNRPGVVSGAANTRIPFRNIVRVRRDNPTRLQKNAILPNTGFSVTISAPH